MKYIGERLREIRKSKNYTIEKLAKELGMSYAGYQKIEVTGNTTISTLHKIASYYKIALNYFIDEKSEEETQIEAENDLRNFTCNMFYYFLSKEDVYSMRYDKLMQRLVYLQNLFLLLIFIKEVYDKYTAEKYLSDIKAFRQSIDAYITSLSNDNIFIKYFQKEGLERLKYTEILLKHNSETKFYNFPWLKNPSNYTSFIFDTTSEILDFDNKDNGKIMNKLSSTSDSILGYANDFHKTYLSVDPEKRKSYLHELFTALSIKDKFSL